VPLPDTDVLMFGLSIPIPWASSDPPANVIQSGEKNSVLVDAETGV